MTTPARARRAAAPVLAALLAACGGGSSGTDQGTGLAVVPPSAEFEAARNGPPPPAQDLTVEVTRTDAVQLVVGVPVGETLPDWLDADVLGTFPSLTLRVWVTRTDLPVGRARTVLRVVLADAGDRALAWRDVVVTFDVVDGVVASPPSLAFAHALGAPAPPAPQPLQLLGDGVAWTAAPSAPWITLSATSGLAPSDLEVSVDPAGFGPGDTTGVITITRVGGGQAPVLVPVTVTVRWPALTVETPPPELGGPGGTDLRPVALRFSLETGAQAWPYAVSFVPDGGGPAWLSVDAPAGQVSAAPVQLWLDADRHDLAEGTLTGQLTVSATVEGHPTSATVPVTLRLSEHRLVPDDDGVALAALPSRARLTQSIRLRDTWGLDDTGWTAATAATWLAVTPSGTAADPLVLQADPTGLPADALQRAAVTVTPAAGAGPPATIEVGLWVGSTDPAAHAVTTVVTDLVADPVRPLLYAHAGGADLLVFDLHGGAPVDAIPGVGFGLGAMAVTSDGRTLYVVDRLDAAIVPIDLETRAPAAAWRVGAAFAGLAAARVDGHPVLFTSTGLAFDLATRQSLGMAGPAGPLVAASVEGSLACGLDTGLSPFSLACHGLAWSTLGAPHLVVDPRPAPPFNQGSDGRDLAVSDDGTRVYVAAGSTSVQGAPYAFLAFDGLTLALAAGLPAAPYPVAVAAGPGGRVFGAVDASGAQAEDLWFYGPGGPLGTAVLAGKVPHRGLAVSGDGLRVVAVTTSPEALVFVPAP